MTSIKLIGVGGIGTCLLAFLPRYLAYQAGINVELTLVDGDQFQARNAERQTFLVQGNKAEVKAQEIRGLFPSLATFAIPEYVTSRNIGGIVQGKDIVLLAVDNHATRLLVSRRCKQLANVTLVSAGNDLTIGNIQVYVRRGRHSLTNPIETFHDEIGFPQDRNPGDDPSCLDQATEGEPQILIANMAAALGMACILYQILGGKTQLAEEVYFDIGTGEFQPMERRVHA